MAPGEVGRMAVGILLERTDTGFLRKGSEDSMAGVGVFC